MRGRPSQPTSTPPASSSSSSPTYACRWDYCARTFTSIAQLSSHLSVDHIPNEQPVYVPAYNRRRRADGAWVLVEESFRLADNLPLPGLTAASGALAGLGVGIVVGVDSLMTDSSLAPSFAAPDFAVPALPFFASAAVTGTSTGTPTTAAAGVGAGASDLDNPITTEPAVDYDAFLRSPSPAQAMFGTQAQLSGSTPRSQVPPPSSGGMSGTGALFGTQPPSSPSNAQAAFRAIAAVQSSPNRSTASSGAHVSPLRSGACVTQAIPPPSSGSVPSSSPQNTAESKDGKDAGTPSSTPSSNASARAALTFGARAAPGESPRRASSGSAVGFSWGMGK